MGALARASRVTRAAVKCACGEDRGTGYTEEVVQVEKHTVVNGNGFQVYFFFSTPVELIFTVCDYTGCTVFYACDFFPFTKYRNLRSLCLSDDWNAASMDSIRLLKKYVEQCNTVYVIRYSMISEHD